MRGVYSQGLIAPRSDFVDDLAATGSDESSSTELFHAFAQCIGVTRYDPPLPECAGIVSPWDSRMWPKSDVERIQNLEWDQDWDSIEWVATEKIDGTSATFDVGHDGVRVFSRNYQIEAEPGDARALLAAEIRQHVPIGYTVQGELYGQNRLKLNGTHFAVFSVFHGGRPMCFAQWPSIAVIAASVSFMSGP